MCGKAVPFRLALFLMLLEAAFKYFGTSYLLGKAWDGTAERPELVDGAALSMQALTRFDNRSRQTRIL